MPQIPKMIPMTDVKDYLEKTFGITLTRQTVYNWARDGKKGRKLRTETRCGQLWTTEAWCDEFIQG